MTCLSDRARIAGDVLNIRRVVALALSNGRLRQRPQPGANILLGGKDGLPKANSQHPMPLASRFGSVLDVLDIDRSAPHAPSLHIHELALQERGLNLL